MPGDAKAWFLAWSMHRWLGVDGALREPAHDSLHRCRGWDPCELRHFFPRFASRTLRSVNNPGERDIFMAAVRVEPILPGTLENLPSRYRSIDQA